MVSIYPIKSSYIWISGNLKLPLITSLHEPDFSAPVTNITNLSFKWNLNDFIYLLIFWIVVIFKMLYMMNYLNIKSKTLKNPFISIFFVSFYLETLKNSSYNHNKGK